MGIKKNLISTPSGRVFLLGLILVVSAMQIVRAESGCDSAVVLENSSLKIATAIPVINSMVEALVECTLIENLYLPPPRYSIKRIPGWLLRQSAEQFPRVDLVAGISSVWPGIDVYPYLRMQNISVIPIDAATALMPEGERVALNVDADTPAYFWLNTANALMMMGIIHRDLVRVVEQSRLPETLRQQTLDRLHNNFDEAGKLLRDIQIRMDSRLSQLPVLQIAVEKDELVPLAQASFLPLTALEDALADDIPTLLITSRKPGHKKLQNIPEHVLLWHIDDFSRLADQPLLARWGDIADAIPAE